MEIVPDKEGGYVVSFPDLPGCITVGDVVYNTEEIPEEEK